jgi:chromate transporter
VLYGIKPAVTAIVAFAAWRIGARILRNPAMWALAMAAFIAIAALHIPFPIIIGTAALIGVLGNRFAPAWFALADHVVDESQREPCVIDDDTPTPAHARFDRKRLLWTLATGLLLWILGIGALTLMFGANGVFTSMAWFFTKAAFLTFGGAYAVLPYVVQGAVEQHHWLSAAQMIDGLALGETTPGPLIMVVAFVGFVGGWTHAALGPDHLAAAGVVAATIVTFFTFLPSFLFILLGGPLVETTRRQPRIAAPLAAITAAIVGVILNLAVYFALNVLWPTGLAGRFEWPLALIGIVAFVCLVRFRVGVVPVIVACGFAGLLLTLIVR